MRYLRNIGGALVGALFAAAVVAMSILPASALVFPGQFAPRVFQTQQTHYERHVVSITSTGIIVDGGGLATPFSSGSASIRIGALPYNAYLLRFQLDTVTACNAGTTCTLALGTASGGGQIAAASTIAAAAITNPTLSGAGLSVTGNGATQSGANGGFDIWLTVAQTGTAATAGTVVVVLEYLGPNDGGCTAVPLNATASAC